MDADGQIAINVDEAARRLCIGRDALYVLIYAGKIPAVKIGRRLVVPIRGLEDAFLALAHEPIEEPRYGRPRNGRRARR